MTILAETPTPIHPRPEIRSLSDLMYPTHYELPPSLAL